VFFEGEADSLTVARQNKEQKQSENLANPFHTATYRLKITTSALKAGSHFKTRHILLHVGASLRNN